MPLDILKSNVNGVSPSGMQISDCLLHAAADTPMQASTVTNILGNDTSTADVDMIPRKKKKKRRAKKSAAKSKTLGTMEDRGAQPNPNVLCISRNKHWKYISSYHGPWLQLPLELLESLLVLNLDPGVSNELCNSSPNPSTPYSLPRHHSNGFPCLRDRSNSRISLASSSGYQHSPTASSMSTKFPPFTTPPGRTAPPPIDPGVFRSVSEIRRLVDEAAELSVRASSGLSAAALGALQSSNIRGSYSLGGSQWAASQALGHNSMGEFGGGGGGRNMQMSATRVHRLRALAVQKLAEAYKVDEIASSVMVMQRGTVFDDIAEKVLKVDPKNIDAQYVHFFHEKIPSRQLAESTSPAILDQLIAESPQRLEFYRTRGVVHCHRDEYTLAVRDFTHVLKESRAARRARQAHGSAQRTKSEKRSKAKRKKARVNEQAHPSGTTTPIGDPDGVQFILHPSILPDAPEPIEAQALFHRGAAYLAHAFFLIEEAFFKLEGIPRIPPNDFGEVQLSYINGKYGGVEIGNPDGPLGCSDSEKAHAYRAVFNEGPLREQVCALLRKSKRDHGKFQTLFDTLEPPGGSFINTSASDPVQRMDRAFTLLETFRPINRKQDPPEDPTVLADVPLAFTTYHPLLLESHFSVLSCMLMLGEFEALSSRLERASNIVIGLEGYPVFLPPRSMAQAEFIESLERLAGGWKYGELPNALVRVRDTLSHSFEHTAPSPMSMDTEYDFAGASSSAGPSTSCSRKASPALGHRPLINDGADNDLGATSDGEAGSQEDRRTALEHLRVLLAPHYSRLRTANEKGRDPSTQPNALNMALHGAHVEVILVWLAAVYLPELEAVTTP